MTDKNILHMLTPLKHMSPFDANMALDAGYDAVLAYSNVYQFVDDVAWVGQLGVRAEARGQGLGRAVLLGTLNDLHDVAVLQHRLEV